MLHPTNVLDMASHSHDERARSLSEEVPLVRLESQFAISDDGTLSCTFVPEDATGAELITTWMTANDGAFVDLSDVV